MSTSHDPTSKPAPFALALTAGAGLVLLIIALAFGVVQGTSANSTVVGLTFAAGLALLALGVGGWLVVVQPFRNFDDINIPQYTGHHEEHHAEPSDATAIIPHE